MFHANAWGMPYAAAAVGAKQVFFAGALEPDAFVDLLVDERVTVTAGVPTVWLGIADELARRGASGSPDLRHIVCGGAQPPRSLIERYASEFGMRIIQAWGMTETSPLASMAWPQEHMRDWSEERGHLGRPDQGRPAAPRGARSASGTTTATRCPPTTRRWATCASRAVGDRRVPPRARRRGVHR